MFQSVFAVAFQVFAVAQAPAELPASMMMSASKADVEVVVPARQQQVRRIKLVVAPTGNEARYRVTERLLGFERDNDAVGKTDKLTGALVFTSNGQIVKEESNFTVDLTAIASDETRRDNYVRNNTLQTAQFPTAKFVPGIATGLPGSLPVAADLTFQISGDFTVHGVTKPTVWAVKGKMLATGEFTGTATTSFNFAEFNIAVPRVSRVLNVTDKITIELDLHLIPEGVLQK